MEAAHDPAEPLREPLTRRERDVLKLLAEGLTSSEIAQELVLAVSTVKSHRQHVYAKLGVRSKRHAVARARALGLLASAASPPAQERPAPPAPARHNLPAQATRFFGREAELTRLKASLAENRVVTLIGAGGVGKTRLALEAAVAELAAFRDGVWLVELAALSDASLVPQQTALALGVRGDPAEPILETLLAALRQRQLLLLIDNCEHVLEACARLAESLLRACPDIKLLATSREHLGTAGEAVFAVPSLSVPDTGPAASRAAIGRSPAVRLLVDRARLVRPEYALTEGNMLPLAHISQRLDGIPLALEMAAARLNLLSAEQLAARLDTALSFLGGSSRTALPKHQTLRATIEWSHQLLSETERMLLRRLSVFAGGCTQEAAEIVCAGEGLAGGEVFATLTALAAKSMIVAARRPGEPARYRLLELVRQYAREQLEAAQETEPLQRKFRDYFLGFAEAPYLSGQNLHLADWDRRLQLERDNFRLALELSFSGDASLENIEAGPRLILAMGGLWPLSWPEILTWNEKALAWCEQHPTLSPSLHVTLLQTAAGTLSYHDLRLGLPLAQRAVAISRALGPEHQKVLFGALLGLASTYSSLNAIQPSQAAYAEAEAIFTELGPDHFGARGFSGISAWLALSKARLANKQAHYAEALAYVQESLRLLAAAGDNPDLFEAYVQMGEANLGLGAFDQARQQFLVALHLDDDLLQAYAGFRRAFVNRCLALVELAADCLGEAEGYCQASLRAARKITARGLVASSLAVAAGIQAKRGRAEPAALLFGASQALYAKQGGPAWEDLSPEELVAGWEVGPQAEAIQQAYAAGQAMSAEEALACALSALE